MDNSRKDSKSENLNAFRFDPNPNVWVKAESGRLITKLFKQYLGSLEDLRYQHEVALDRLKETLTPEQVEVLNYLDFHRYSMVRKRTLDNGNEIIRDLHNFLENFDVHLKNNTLKENLSEKEKGD
jgi:hypothetical protein